MIVTSRLGYATIDQIIRPSCL